MASATAAVTMAMAAPSAVARRGALASSDALFQPLRQPSTKAAVPVTGRSHRRLQVRASSSLKEQAVTGLTAAVMAAALALPDVAEAAQPGVSPSLKNFLLSIVSGGVVLGVILGAVIAVSNFDPVKRS